MKTDLEITETTTAKTETPAPETVPFFARKVARPALIVKSGVRGGAA